MTPDLVMIRAAGTLGSHDAGVLLRRDAAASWFRMERDRGRPLDSNSTYRDWAEQQKARDDYLAGRGPLALRPEDSWHCLGLAADTDDDAWMRANPGYGWRFVVASERWHAQYYPHLDLYSNQTVDLGSTPFEGQDMALTDADIGKLLNYPAWTPRPGVEQTGADGALVPISISEHFRNQHDAANAVHAAIFDGGPDMPDNGRSIGASLEGIVDWLDGKGNAIAVDAKKAAGGSAVEPPKA